MYKVSELQKPVYRTGEVAKIVGVTTQTLRVYDRTGILKFERTAGGHRLVSRDELLAFLDKRGMLFDDSTLARRDVIYARVDEPGEESKLNDQVTRVVEHAPKLKNPLVIKEVGNGLDETRTELARLMGMVENGEVETVYITGRDRLATAGYKFLESAFSAKGVRIAVVGEEKED